MLKSIAKHKGSARREGGAADGGESDGVTELTGRRFNY
jgi:hypothetical protein